MKALVFDGRLRFLTDYPTPRRQAGEALIRVRLAGICNTDQEIIKGYMGFTGVLGHEFVGQVAEADDSGLVGRRVVGEINCACGHCPTCRQGLSRHCPQRTVLGILQRDGALAEYLTLPMENLHLVPEAVSDEQAVLVEPLAAALEIFEQGVVKPSDQAVVLGDGKLGQLIARVLWHSGCRLTVIGRHPHKLTLLQALGIPTAERAEVGAERFDLVVDATGSAQGFQEALSLVRPRGTLVLKSTVAAGYTLNLAPLVIDEVTVVGSRCGPFPPALRLLEQQALEVDSLITHRFPLDEGQQAFSVACGRDALKVLVYP